MPDGTQSRFRLEIVDTEYCVCECLSEGILFAPSVPFNMQSKINQHVGFVASRHGIFTFPQQSVSKIHVKYLSVLAEKERVA